MGTWRHKAALKAAATRRANAASREYHKKATIPAQENVDGLLHMLIAEKSGIRVWWAGERRLRLGADSGLLLKTFDGGRIWRVLIDGYKHSQDFHAAYWRIR